MRGFEGIVFIVHIDRLISVLFYLYIYQVEHKLGKMGMKWLLLLASDGCQVRKSIKMRDFLLTDAYF